EALGDAALWEAHPDESIACRQRAHDAYLARGDRRGAARVALALVVNHIIRLSPSVAAGWFNKARRLLDGEPESPEHAWLAFTTSLAQIAAGEFEAGLESARTTHVLGCGFGDRDLEA